MSNSKPVLTKEDLGNRLKNFSFELRQTQISAKHWFYRERASVRVEYSLEEFKPSEGKATLAEQEAIKKLLEESTVTYRSDNRPVWRLKHDVRHKTLKRLSEQGRLHETLESNPSIYSSHLQEMFNKYILGIAPPLEEQSLNQLEATLQVVDWLRGCLPILPLKEQIRLFIAHKRLLKPFHFLVGKHFKGRKRELNKLREYVGVLSAIEEGDSSITSIGSNSVRPLLIYGPGGIGKSTLIAKFILEHAELECKQRIPYVYIDFNRRDIEIQEPASILLEAYRQLGIQYPFAEKLFTNLGKELRSRMEEYSFDDSTHFSIQTDIKQNAYVSARRRRWNRFVRDFAETVSDILKTKMPFLIVLDTIEEMLYHNIEYLDELWKFLEYLQDTMPTLRLVLSGRSTLPIKYLTQNILLNGLDSIAALELLIKRGIPDKTFAHKIIEVVGRSPFSLWLAADLYHRMERDFRDFEDIEERHEYFYKVKEYFIHGQLYKRILGHIHDPRIKSLAHPGMILRRITPDLILNVLAVPCKIKVKDLDDAQDLFDKLRKEISLVEINQENPNEIRQRSELRLAMLELLLQDEPGTAKMIHQLAATYFRKQVERQSPPDLQDRVDEVYHRLALGENPAFLENYTQSDLQVISEELGSSIQDLPAKAQTFLVSRAKLDIQLDDSVWAEADLESWEHMILRSVQNLLNLGRYEEALQKLNSRENRTTGSPLYQLHVLALIGLNKIDAAMKILEAGICRTPPYSKETQNLLQLSASIYEEKGQLSKAHENNVRALKIAQRIEDDMAILRIQLKIVRLMRTHFPLDAPEIQQGYKYLIEAWEAISDEQILQNPALIRDVATQIGHESPSILKRTVRLVGFGSEKPTNLSTLASAMASWDDLISSEHKKQSGILARSVNAEWRGDLYETWMAHLEKTSWDIISTELSHLIKEHKITPTISITLVELIKAKLLLNTQQSSLLEAVLQDAFTQDELRNLIEDQLGISIAEVSRAKSIDKQTTDLVSWVESNGQTLRLLQALIVERPNHPQIINLLKELNVDYQSIPVFTNAEQAISYYNQELKRSIKKEDREGEANAYEGLANAYAKQTKGDQGNNFNQAINYLNQALKIRHEILGEHHPDTAQNIHKLGLLLQDMGNLTEAKLCYDDTLSIDLKVYGANHPNVARDYNNLGSIYNELGESKKAIEFYEKALAIDLEVYGDNHPNVTRYYGNLGSTYSALGDSQKAIELYQRALAIDLEVYGDKHPNVAVSLNNLGIAYSDLGDFKKSIELYEKALAIDLEVYGDNHPNVARDFNNLGIVHSNLGDFKKSIEFYERALAIDLKVYGDKHPNVAVSLSNIGSTYSDLRESKKAIEFYERALAIDLKVYGDKHPNVARDYNNLGIAYSDLGDFKKSIEYYKRAFEIDSKVYGDNHPNVAVSLNNLGIAYGDLGDFKKAIEFYERALAIDLKVYGDNHPNVARDFNNLGIVYSNLGDLQKAIEFYEKALSIDLEVYGDNHPNVARDFNNLGIVHSNLGDLQKAIEFYEKALSIDLEVYGDKHPNVAKKYNNLGSVYREMENFQKSIEFYKQALAINSSIYGDSHPIVKTIKENLIEAVSIDREVKGVKITQQAETVRGQVIGAKIDIDSLDDFRISGSPLKDFDDVLDTVCSSELIQQGKTVIQQTAFLISPHLILTVFHGLRDVLEGQLLPQDLTFRFGLLETESKEILSHGQAYALAMGSEAQARFQSENPWLVATNDTIDYAILRLSRPAGEEIADGLLIGRPRGWLKLAEEVHLAPGDWLGAVQFVRGLDPFTTYRENAFIGISDDGQRLIHQLDIPSGLSGGPIFNSSREVVAVHQSELLDGAGTEYTFNKSVGYGVFVPAVVKDLKRKGLWPIYS